MASDADIERQLLGAVIAQPDDDAARLVYADFLSQRGDLRGEFIVASCTLARPDSVPRAVARALAKRVAAMFEAHASSWLKDLGLKVGEGRFVRGLVEEVDVPATKLDARLFERTPLRRLSLSSTELEAAVAISAPTLRPFLPRLRALSLTGRKVAEALFAIDTLTGLESLRINAHDGEVEQLSDSVNLPVLKHLQLNQNHLTERAASSLSHATFAGQLKTLELSVNALTDQGARSLARASALTPLTELSLGLNQLTSNGASALAASSHVANLQVLDLSFNAIGDMGVVELARSMWLKNLTTLNLDQAHVGAVGARSLMTSETLPNLKVLSLRYNDFGEVEARALRERFGSRVRL